MRRIAAFCFGRRRDNSNVVVPELGAQLLNAVLFGELLFKRTVLEGRFVVAFFIFRAGRVGVFYIRAVRRFFFDNQEPQESRNPLAGFFSLFGVGKRRETAEDDTAEESLPAFEMLPASEEES